MINALITSGRLLFKKVGIGGNKLNLNPLYTIKSNASLQNLYVSKKPLELFSKAGVKEMFFKLLFL